MSQTKRKMKIAISLCMVIVGLINFAPVIGVLSTESLEAAYSVSIVGDDLALLMRHRALLFGILGAFILYSVYRPQYQRAAMIMAGASMIGFALLVLTSAGYNEAIGRVLLIDVIGLGFLFAAAVLKYRESAQ